MTEAAVAFRLRQPVVPMPLSDLERWERLVHYGEKQSGKEKQAVWRQGDVCRIIRKRYGEDALGQFASECHVPKGTLLRRRWLSKRFSGELKSARWKYGMLDLTFLEIVAHVKDDDELRGYLDQAADEWAAGRAYSKAQFQALVAGKPVPTICRWYSQHCEKTGEETTPAGCRYSCEVPEEERHAAIL